MNRNAIYEETRRNIKAPSVQTKFSVLGYDIVKFSIEVDYLKDNDSSLYSIVYVF